MMDNHTIAANAAAQDSLDALQRWHAETRGRKRIGAYRTMRITLPDALTSALDRWIERNGYPMSRERALVQLAKRGLEIINGR
jgi:hypothetical protein